nr:PEGA domain-containing protein [Kofleriaceae bacterium]
PAPAPAPVVPAASAPEPMPAPVVPAPVVPAPVVPAPVAPAPAAAVPATPLPAAPPSVAAASLVDVVFTSRPDGASVVLVDDGRTTPIGQTPVSAALDPSRRYEVMFALDGHKTKIEKLDPRRTTRLGVRLRTDRSRRSGAEEVASSSSSSSRSSRSSRSSPPRAAAPAVAATPALAKPSTAAATGDGILMINAKPPCEILVDGKATGLTTPQRAMSLPVGTHQVTLVNAQYGIRKKLSVTISAGKATKVIQDLTASMQ